MIIACLGILRAGEREEEESESKSKKRSERSWRRATSLSVVVGRRRVGGFFEIDF